MTPPIPWPPGPATAVLEVPARTQVTAPGRPAVLPVPGRSLVLVAGLPGAGKTTLLRTLGKDRAVRVSDSDPLRAAVLRLIPRGTRYGIVRPAVHLLHRSAVAALALGPAPVVVVHLPATSARLRRAVIWLARLSRRTPHLVWLDAAPAEARDGQRIRGRAITSRSFGRHVRRARRTSERLLAGELSEGWATTLRLDRQSARHGLRIEMRPGRSPLSS